MPIAGYIHGIPVAASSEYHDYIETVAVEGKTEFTLDYDITADHRIEIDIDGRNEPLEGTNWTRNVAANKIILAEGIHVSSVFKARIHIL
jgi:hypothetical protein